MHYDQCSTQKKDSRVSHACKYKRMLCNSQFIAHWWVYNIYGLMNLVCLSVWVLTAWYRDLFYCAMLRTLFGVLQGSVLGALVFVMYTRVIGLIASCAVSSLCRWYTVICISGCEWWNKQEVITRYRYNIYCFTTFRQIHQCSQNRSWWHSNWTQFKGEESEGHLWPVPQDGWSYHYCL